MEPFNQNLSPVDLDKMAITVDDIQPASQNLRATSENDEWEMVENTTHETRRPPSPEHNNDHSFIPAFSEHESNGTESPSTAQPIFPIPYKAVTFSVPINPERAPAPSTHRSRSPSRKSASFVQETAQNDRREVNLDNQDDQPTGITPPPEPQAKLPAHGNSVLNLSGRVTKLTRFPIFEGTYSSVYKGSYNEREVSGLACI